jgi:hypothetical protein
MGRKSGDLQRSLRIENAVKQRQNRNARDEYSAHTPEFKGLCREEFLKTTGKNRALLPSGSEVSSSLFLKKPLTASRSYSDRNMKIEVCYSDVSPVYGIGVW